MRSLLMCHASQQGPSSSPSALTMHILPTVPMGYCSRPGSELWEEQKDAHDSGIEATAKGALLAVPSADSTCACL